MTRPEHVAGLVAGLHVEDATTEELEAAHSLLLTDAEMQKALTVESLRGFTDAACAFLRRFPGWGR